MLDRFGLYVKIACVLLAVLVGYECSRAVARWNPLGQVNIPELPALPTTSVTNTMTNRSQSLRPPSQTTNANSTVTNINLSSANTNLTVTNTNLTVTNTNLTATNTNLTATNTNLTAASANMTVTNTNAPQAMARITPNPSGRAATGPKGLDLPPEMQARIERITQSEVLAPFMRPLPMALMGIAGDRAFLRASNGQTGVIKTGEEVAGLKLLRIGINRVLVEEDGKPKELTIFSGFGGESLLPKSTETKP